MFLSRLFVRKAVSSTRRPLSRRQPLVEDLEGRRLLSTLTVTAAVQGAHIGGPVADIQGAHIGTNAAIVGQHIGTNLV
jgi:S1-C subfamily serine protease